MGKILVIDDASFWRDVTADALRRKGYDVVTAGDGLDGLAVMARSGADLVLLDMEMPRLQGLAFLEQLRSRDDWKNVPVIMLTGDTEKNHVLRAHKLGAVDYLLKSQFSLEILLDRVERRMRFPDAPAKNARRPAPAVAKIPPPFSNEIPQLMDRNRCMARIDQAMKDRSLSGVVTQVIAMAGSQRADMAQLADLVAHDPLVASRVMKAANSAMYTTAKAPVSTIPDAVKKIGCSAIRDIAAMVGVFDAMPPSEADGFNPLRCWQHSLAAAALCAKLAPPAQSGVAYLVGLCHDLGDVFFHGHFGTEYRKVIEMEKISRLRRDELERRMLGMSRAQLVQLLLDRMKLPPAITTPIRAFHDADAHQINTDPLAGLLQIADLYATGLLLASSDQAAIRPMTAAECRAATGNDHPARPDGMVFRNEISSMTALLARLSAKEEAQLLKPLLPRRDVVIRLAREPSLSKFDPIAAALSSLATVRECDAPPHEANLEDCDGMVIVTGGASAEGFAIGDIRRALDLARAKDIKSLWLTDRGDGLAAADHPDEAPLAWPVSLAKLAEFVGTL